MVLPRGADRRKRARPAWPNLAITLLVAVALAGCEPEPPPPSDPELRESLGIPGETPIHRVDLSGRGDQTRVLPRTIDIHPGDLVQFVVLDHRVHLIRFPEDRIAPPLLGFLADTDQDRPPPLVEQGARLVLDFGGAPSGVYAFQVEGYGSPVEGEIRVVEPPEPRGWLDRWLRRMGFGRAAGGGRLTGPQENVHDA